jgi:hypothetical protein
LFSFEESLRGKGSQETDSRDMDHANRVERRRQLQERKREAVMISKRVTESYDKHCPYCEENHCHHFTQYGTESTFSSSSAETVPSQPPASSAWWSDLMTRKAEAEEKGYSSIMGTSLHMLDT